MTRNGGKIRFEGKGYGHGVGLSQWGAYVMAKEGYSCSDILKHYYTGIEIR
jgi:stage II sporulation protein D